MATKRKRIKKMGRVSDRTIDQGVALLKDSRLSAKKKQNLRNAALAGIYTGEISLSQFCRILQA